MVEPHGARVGSDGHEVQLIPGGSPEHEQAERDLLARGVPLPLPHRAIWARYKPAAGFWFVLARDPAGAPSGGFMLEVRRSRALPGHLLLLSERFGDSLPLEVAVPTLQGFASLMGRDSRILRVDIEVFSPDAGRRSALGKALAGAGFGPAQLTRSYVETLTGELLLPTEEHLATLSVNTRRHVRAIHKRPVALRLIEDDVRASVIEERA